MNEAAIIAARNNKSKIDLSDFEKASERVLAGLETNRKLSDIERKTVAYHESGHAIVGWFLKHCSPIVKITIIPRSKGSLGFTQYVPDDTQLHSKEQLIDMICMTLGGRMAEELFFNRITTGASDDLQKVSSIARNMVTRFGMSKLGYRSFGSGAQQMNKPYSADTERLIDDEVENIIRQCLELTRNIVRERKEEITLIAEELLRKDTINLIDIIDKIGERPFKLSKSMLSYVEEIRKRRMKEKEEKEAKEKLEAEKKEKEAILETTSTENTEKDNDNDKDSNNDSNNSDNSNKDADIDIDLNAKEEKKNDKL